MGCLVSCAVGTCCSALCNALCPVCCWCKAKDCMGFESVRWAKIPHLVMLFISAAIAGSLRADFFNIRLAPDVSAGCDPEFEERCQDNQSVYRVSFAAALFFSFLAITTRCSVTVHTHWWLPKIGLWIALFIVAFFIPNGFYDGYVHFARFISAFYLFVQVVILINFAYKIHDLLNSKAAPDGTACNDVYLMGYLALALSAFVASIVGIALIFVYFAVEGCQLEQFFTSWTLLMGLLGIAISVSSKINMGLLTPCLVFLYGVYVLWDALLSGPDDMCNPTADQTEGNNEVAVIIVSLIITAGSVTWTSYRTGVTLTNITDEHVEDAEEGKPGAKTGDFTLSSNMRDIVAGEEGKTSSSRSRTAGSSGPADEGTALVVGPDTTHGKPLPDPAGEMLWLFHFILAVASIYLSMALTNWGASDGETEASAPSSTGYFNVWAKITSQWVTFALYYATLTAPYCRGEDNSL